MPYRGSEDASQGRMSGQRFTPESRRPAATVEQEGEDRFKLPEAEEHIRTMETRKACEADAPMLSKMGLGKQEFGPIMDQVTRNAAKFGSSERCTPEATKNFMQSCMKGIHEAYHKRRSWSKDVPVGMQLLGVAARCGVMKHAIAYVTAAKLLAGGAPVENVEVFMAYIRYQHLRRSGIDRSSASCVVEQS